MAIDPDADIKLPGPIRRNAPLLAGIAAVIIVGPAFSRLIEGYRGVVLDVAEGEMFVGFDGTPPKWAADVGSTPGDIVAKERGSWDATVVPTDAADHALVKMQKRYARTYKGTVLRIAKPKVPNGPHIALVQLDPADGGGKMNLPLHGQHLAACAVGSRLEKTASSWEPVLMDEPLVELDAGGGAPPQGPGPVVEMVQTPRDAGGAAGGGGKK